MLLISTVMKAENMWFLTFLKFTSAAEACVGTTLRTKHHWDYVLNIFCN